MARKKAAKKRESRSARRGVTFDDVREIAMGLPGAEEGTSYGTPAWRVRKKLFARVHDSGEWLVVKIDLDDRELALAADPKTFFVTDHYAHYPAMLVHLGRIRRAGLEEVVEDSWRSVAPKRLIAELDAAT